MTGIRNQRAGKALCVILLAGMLVFTAAGCGSSSPNSGEGDLTESAVEESESGEAAETEAVEEEEEIDYSQYVKMPDEELDIGLDLTDEEFQQLQAVQFLPADDDAPIATIKTSKGDIRLVLYPRYAPLAVENFITHAQNGYYDGVVFHRVIEDFMVQTGDPTGTGYGGESIYTNDAGESIPFVNEVNYYLRHFRGALSMANSGAHTNGSQFFIVQNATLPYTEEYFLEGGLSEEDAARYTSDLAAFLEDYMACPADFAEKYVSNGGYPPLDFNYTVFGMVLEGMDVVDAIAAVETEDDRPLEEITVETITIENA